MSPLVSIPIDLWGEDELCTLTFIKADKPNSFRHSGSLIPILDILGYIRHAYLALVSVWSTHACCSIQCISTKWRKWMSAECAHTHTHPQTHRGQSISAIKLDFQNHTVTLCFVVLDFFNVNKRKPNSGKQHLTHSPLCLHSWEGNLYKIYCTDELAELILLIKYRSICV